MVLLLALAFLFTASTRTKALSGSDFNPGTIISDELFYKGGDMSIVEIDGFLKGKVAVCDTIGSKPYAGGTRADYGTRLGYAPPYTCLKDYSNTQQARAADAYCAAIPAGEKNAATVIYEVSVACGVGAKSLMVLIEKEQSLLTDEWPFVRQYRSATGYGCPDTAECDTSYYGFYNQVYNAARQLRVYAARPDLFRHKPFQVNNVLFNPDFSCGSSPVFINTKATAALYNYTPYQPNASSLANLNGSGDACGAYGNRNFWRLYNDWFGSTGGATQAEVFNLRSEPKTTNTPLTTLIAAQITKYKCFQKSEFFKIDGEESDVWLSVDTTDKSGFIATSKSLREKIASDKIVECGAVVVVDPVVTPPPVIVIPPPVVVVPPVVPVTPPAVLPPVPVANPYLIDNGFMFNLRSSASTRQRRIGYLTPRQITRVICQVQGQGYNIQGVRNSTWIMMQSTTNGDGYMATNQAIRDYLAAAQIPNC
jgi:hypothetical protein